MYLVLILEIYSQNHFFYLVLSTKNVSDCVYPCPWEILATHKKPVRVLLLSLPSTKSVSPVQFSTELISTLKFQPLITKNYRVTASENPVPTSVPVFRQHGSGNVYGSRTQPESSATPICAWPSYIDFSNWTSPAKVSSALQ